MMLIFSGFSQLNNTSSNKKITEISERVQNVKIFEDDYMLVKNLILEDLC